MGPKLLYQQDPVRGSVKALGSKWTLLILRDIGFLRLERFGEILRNNPGLTPRVLSRRLRNMQKEGLVERTVRSDRITYMLTSRGEDAAYVLLAFLRYGLKYHAASPGVTKLKSLPSFQDLVKEYHVGKSDNKDTSSSDN
jgi:DNA-binding HxlR family transcriptional regulator